MASYGSLKELFADIAKAIREKDNTLSQFQASNFPTAISFYLSSKKIEDGLISGTGLSYYENDRITRVKEGFFKGSSIEEARLGSYTSVVHYEKEAFKGSLLKRFTHAPSNTSDKTANYPTFGIECFADCTALTVVRLNVVGVVNIFEEDTFLNTPIADKTGHIYVPSKKLSAFQAEYPQYSFRAIQSYTEDGSIYGELDPNKI